MQFTGAASLCSVVGRGQKKERQFCLVDIKEAVEATAPIAKRAEMPQDFAQGVVTGACNLSPFLGERMLADKFLGRSVVVRKVMPQDLKLEIDQLTRDEAVSAVRYLAAVVGKACACATDDARRAWMLLDGYGAANSSQITRPLISNIVHGMQ